LENKPNNARAVEVGMENTQLFPAHNHERRECPLTGLYVQVKVNCLFLSLKAEPTAVYLPYIM